MAYVSFVAQLLRVSEDAGGVDVCLQMRGFTEIELSANIATSEDTAIGKNIYPTSLHLVSPLSLSLPLPLTHSLQNMLTSSLSRFS